MKGIDLDCIKRYPWELEFADKQTYEMCVEALRRDGMLLEHVKFDELNLTKEQLYNLYLIAVKQDGFALKFIKEQTEEICIEAVKEYYLALEFVKEQTERICLEAVKECHTALFYIKQQTPEICIEAIKNNKNALCYVKNPTEDIYIEALKQDKLIIKYIKDKEKYLDMFNIKYLEKQGKAREVIAIKENGKWLFTLDCQYKITKDEFIERIYNENGGFNPEKGVNIHRQVYLNFLKEFK
ncbi:TPA: hypothetical protein KOR49_002193 [Clostridioides difficile]|nr:DUF4116 domain-containing protein [Clostridioides difficile]EGT3945313.1 hypothetical protein [Clostridioides difficile]MBG0198947.1 hypothetical protein [Clostridioides difficile]MCA0574390.1 hypothetical protein [Clostridioides difficile]PBG25679.1 hypothetical protein BGU81_12765 [Clostridioides difficile]SJT14443.1 Uncharacterised protein [Clostridioides difficile]